MSPRKQTPTQSRGTKPKNDASLTEQERVVVKSGTVPTLPLEKIVISQSQPRSYFDPEKLEQLTISVKEHGVLEPLLVRPLPDGNYELVAGERRFRAATEVAEKAAQDAATKAEDAEDAEDAAQKAAQKAENIGGAAQKATQKAVEAAQKAAQKAVEAAQKAAQKAEDAASVPVVIKELTDSEALQLSLVENLQREDLNPVEETEGILQLLALTLKLETEEVVLLLYQMQNLTAGKTTDSVISKSKIKSVNEVFTSLGKMNRESFTANRLSILRLPENILEAIRQGKIAYTKGKAIARVPDEAARAELLENAIANDLSLSQIRELIKKFKPAQEKQQLKNRFDTTYKQVKKSKQLWEDPKKTKKLKSLLSQLEKLIESE